jgi:hypothetical protein
MERDTLFASVLGMHRAHDALVGFSAAVRIERVHDSNKSYTGTVKAAEKWGEAIDNYDAKRVIASIVCGKKTNEAFFEAAISNTVARSADGGRTWILGGKTPFPGAIYGLSYVRELCRDDEDPYDHSDGCGHSDGNHDRRSEDRRVVATGPAGAAWSADEGSTWISLPNVQNYWAVAFASHEAGWFVGTEGRILKISF